MPEDITCDLCGGTDFYKEAGYFYCKDCQTQTQVIEEHAFEEQQEGMVMKEPGKKVRKKKTDDNPENYLTSWECYNYILMGLVDELIELGANKELKTTVKVLWYKYLKELEVVQDDPTATPKLPAVNNTIDAEILYGRKSKSRKRRRQRSESPSSTSNFSTSDGTSLQWERAQKRRALTKANYEEYMSTQQTDTTSLHDQSLATIKSSSEKSSKNPDNYLVYNKLAQKEILKHMTKNHLKTHRKDTDSLITCHSPSYANVSKAYTMSAEFLSRNKMFGLLYLGLLINKDTIQLGDMLRFIREGHLSYNEYKHFFPEEVSNMKLNISSYAAKTSFLTHYGLREITSKLAHKLNISVYVPVQNLVDLCNRYCKELNLPDEMVEFVVNLISRSKPVMDFTKKSTIIPNYEGRSMSFIVFTLKLLLGLDGVTEHNLSNIANNINNSSPGLKKAMYNWNNWITLIEYRKLVLSEEYFPVSYTTQSFGHSELFINFINDHRGKYYDIKLNEPIEVQVLKSNLQKLKSLQDDMKKKIQFMHSLTPFNDYVRTVLDLSKNKYSDEILSYNHAKTTFDFLMSPYLYKEFIINHLEVIKDVESGEKGVNEKDITGECINGKDINGKDINGKDINGKGIKEKGIDQKIINQKTISNVRTVLNEKLRFIEMKNARMDNERVIKEQRKMVLVEFETKKGNLKSVEKYLYKKSGSKEKEGKDIFDEENCVKSQKRFEKFKEQHGKRHNLTRKHFKNLLCNEDINQVSINEDKHIDSVLQPFERFWLQSHDIQRFSIEKFNDYFKTLPYSFQLLVGEGSRIVEQNVKYFYEEYNLTELYLCYKVSYRYEKESDFIDGELKRLLNIARKFW